MVPVLRYQAIDAGIRQAEAELRGVEAMARQSSHDLAARITTDLAIIHDAQRQIDLYERSLLPRAQDLIAAQQRTYATGQSTMLDMLDSQRSLIALKRMRADLEIMRNKEIIDFESVAALRLASALHPHDK